MGVLVGVQVRRAQAGVQNPAHLGGQLLIRPELPRRERREQPRDRCRQRTAGHERAAADQDQVAADIERGVLAREAERVLERLAVGHQGGRGQDTAAVGFHNSLVDVRREAEIVRVDDQLFARAFRKTMHERALQR